MSVVAAVYFGDVFACENVSARVVSCRGQEGECSCVPQLLIAVVQSGGAGRGAIWCPIAIRPVVWMGLLPGGVNRGDEFATWIKTIKSRAGNKNQRGCPDSNTHLPDNSCSVRVYCLALLHTVGGTFKGMQTGHSTDSRIIRCKLMLPIAFRGQGFNCFIPIAIPCWGLASPSIPSGERPSSGSGSGA